MFKACLYWLLLAIVSIVTLKSTFHDVQMCYDLKLSRNNKRGDSNFKIVVNKWPERKNLEFRFECDYNKILVNIFPNISHKMSVYREGKCERNDNSGNSCDCIPADTTLTCDKQTSLLHQEIEKCKNALTPSCDVIVPVARFTDRDGCHSSSHCNYKGSDEVKLCHAHWISMTYECQPIHDPCSLNPCGDTGTCVSASWPEVFTCICYDCYTGSRCETNLNDEFMECDSGNLNSVEMRAKLEEVLERMPMPMWLILVIIVLSVVLVLGVTASIVICLLLPRIRKRLRKPRTDDKSFVVQYNHVTHSEDGDCMSDTEPRLTGKSSESTSQEENLSLGTWDDTAKIIKPECDNSK